MKYLFLILFFLTAYNPVFADNSFNFPVHFNSTVNARDNFFNLKDNLDITKILQFQLSGISTATTRTITMPDMNVDLGGLVNANISAGAAIAYSKLNLANSILNSDVSAGAAIAYSKLNLANSIVNADVSATAAIAYSKLNLANSIVNADVSASAAIARSKLGTGTANYVVINDGGGLFSSESALAVVRGGTGQSSYNSGQLLIGTSAGGLAKANLSAGSNITITNGDGTITIAATGGSSTYTVNPESSNYTILTSDQVILADSSGGGFTLTLPTASGNTGLFFVIKKVSTDGNSVTIDANGSQTIDGELTQILTAPYTSISIISDGSNWLIF